MVGRQSLSIDELRIILAAFSAHGSGWKIFSGKPAGYRHTADSLVLSNHWPHNCVEQFAQNLPGDSCEIILATAGPSPPASAGKTESWSRRISHAGCREIFCRKSNRQMVQARFDSGSLPPNWIRQRGCFCVCRFCEPHLSGQPLYPLTTWFIVINGENSGAKNILKIAISGVVEKFNRNW